MHIEQIIEFQLRVPPGRTCIPKTVKFQEKTKISKENLGVDYYLLLKYFRRQLPYFPLPGPKHLQNLTQNARF